MQTFVPQERQINPVKETVRKKQFDLGKFAYYGEWKLNRITLDLELTYDHRACAPYLDIDFNPCHTYTELSICGSIWNGRGTNIVCCGQIYNELRKYFRTGKVRRMLDLWERWHLNGMRAGSRLQETALKGYFHAKKDDAEFQGQLRINHYSVCCEVLKQIGLYEDRGYKYGHAWLVEPLPSSVEEEIREFFAVKNISGDS